MGKQRIVNDSFWTDPYIEDLDPSEKLVFLYLLTNPLCNIAGIYEIKVKRIAYETGFDKDMTEKILNRFVEDKKILKVDDWVVLVNFGKNQSTNPNVLKGIQRIIDELPEKVKALKGFESLSHFTLLNLTLLNSTLLNSENSEEEKGLDEKIIKHKYGEFKNIELSENEIEKLKQDYGENIFNKYIKILDEGIEMKGYKYKNHNLALRNWMNRDGVKKLENKTLDYNKIYE